MSSMAGVKPDKLIRQNRKKLISGFLSIEIEKFL
jgi:hypothetical protein